MEPPPRVLGEGSSPQAGSQCGPLHEAQSWKMHLVDRASLWIALPRICGYGHFAVDWVTQR